MSKSCFVIADFYVDGKEAFFERGPKDLKGFGLVNRNMDFIDRVRQCAVKMPPVALG
jgi:hypothetical protein